MVLSLLRVVFGFAVACLAAGLTLVLFVVTPAELFGLETAALGERLSQVGLLGLLAATQGAVFSAPFSMLALGFGEWQRVRSVVYYAISGLSIAIAGFLAQHASESQATTIVNDYALRAYLATGLVGGIVYWFVAGRRAGGRVTASNGSAASPRPA